jgi:hypothetical protein
VLRQSAPRKLEVVRAWSLPVGSPDLFGGRLSHRSAVWRAAPKADPLSAAICAARVRTQEAGGRSSLATTRWVTRPVWGGALATAQRDVITQASRATSGLLASGGRSCQCCAAGETFREQVFESPKSV